MNRELNGPRRTDQHYLPACLLGRFSRDSSAPRLRHRPIAAFDSRAGKVLVGSAESFGKVKGLYDMLERPTSVDSLWGYEDRLSRALDELLDESAPLDGWTWVTTLVPFVASLFARSVSFARSFEQRLPDWLFAHQSVPARKDNITAARVQELQRMLAPVMTAQWTVVHFSEEAELITNDAGFALADVPEAALVAGAAPAAQVLSYAIPIGRHAVLFYRPREVDMCCGLTMADGSRTSVTSTFRRERLKASVAYLEHTQSTPCSAPVRTRCSQQSP